MCIRDSPYDVYSREEAREITEKNPNSFLKIDRPETQFPVDIDMYSQPVYDKAAQILDSMINDGSFIQDETPCYYVYALTMQQHTQTLSLIHIWAALCSSIFCINAYR